MSARGGRVLIIDDDPLVRDSLCGVLREAGYQVDVAADGEAGLRALEAHAPDVILVDLMMPGMNGRQFLRSLRAQDGYARIPVILMTGVHGLTVPPAALGASDVVEKPFKVEELLNKVALAEYRSRQARGSAPPPTHRSAAVVAPLPARRAATPVPMLGEASLPGPADGGEQGVVMLVLRDRAALQRLDALLSSRGYTVVSLSRVQPQLPRMVRALRPRALIADVLDADERAIVDQVQGELGGPVAPLILVTREHPLDAAGTATADRSILGLLELLP